MSPGREADISRAFVSMASSLAKGYDVVELLEELTTDCARLLDVATAGLLLADARGVLHLVAASSEATRMLEILQLQRQDGPCLDCYRTATPVSVDDLENAAERWPVFVPAALAAGFASVHALPMRLRDSTLGALGLFGTHVGALNDDDLVLGQGLADVASVALLQDRAAADSAVVREQLQNALNSRVVLEQAKGVLAQLGNLQMDQAFAAMRGYARAHQLALSAVAQEIVARSLLAQTVLDHASARRITR
ncbi:MAG: hypothetical protein QOJ60_2386 [Actinomycetota bacterium]|nr:hypothetical protein [Actinomycetota bacterium]